ncbi:MAG: LpxL/LpxP family Kdo(2)-lipid IV(A) lauroyl/palmitoleoyl acyltransferase [Succinatimonas hippei]|nr:LpxL/LpxP family Kdo(2)-lipid IV(A) lauroyl/palmitoleoyl acyltransferase [Succinatimonas hippei]
MGIFSNKKNGTEEAKHKKILKLHSSYRHQSKERRHNKRFFLVKEGWGRGFVDKAPFSARMLHPYFWGSWLIIGLFWTLVTFLPYPVLMFLGRQLGLLIGNILPSRRYVLSRNIELAFPELEGKEKRRFKRRVLENSGVALFETGIAWFWSDRRLRRRIVCDENELKAARELAAKNPPTIVLTAHFVTLEIMARAYAMLIKPGIGVYRPSEHPVWEWMQVKGRLRDNLALVSSKDPRSMIRALMRRVPIWYAPDQDYGAKVSIFAPFFGVRNVATVTGTHDLARVRGTVVQPSWTMRDHGKYILRVLKPLDNFPTDDVLSDTVRINSVLENMIRERPDQYLWLHRRFKTRPEGEPSRYPGLEDGGSVAKGKTAR